MNRNPKRPVEELTGNNCGIVRMKLANIHCQNRILEQCRKARPNNMRSYPVALRRGWALCVLETIDEYQDTYRAVVTGQM